MAPMAGGAAEVAAGIAVETPGLRGRCGGGQARPGAAVLGDSAVRGVAGDCPAGQPVDQVRPVVASAWKRGVRALAARVHRS